MKRAEKKSAYERDMAEAEKITDRLERIAAKQAAKLKEIERAVNGPNTKEV